MIKMWKKLSREAKISFTVLFVLMLSTTFLIDNYVTSEWYLQLFLLSFLTFFSINSIVIIHELGHLLVGLLTGYKFGHFSFSNIIIYKSKGKIKVKYIKQPKGSFMMGHCLMVGDIEDIKKVSAFIRAGNLFNVASILIVIFMIVIIDQIPLKIMLFYVMGIYLFTLYSNTILMRNYETDGRILKQLRNNESMIKILNFSSNFLYSSYNGLRPRDIDVDLVKIQIDKMDWNDPLLVSFQLKLYSIYYDKGETEKYKSILEEIEKNIEFISKDSVTHGMMRQFLFGIYVNKPNEKDKVAKYVTKEIFELFLSKDDLGGKLNTAEYYYYILGDIENAKKYAIEAKKLLKNDLKIGIHPIIEEEINKII